MAFRKHEYTDMEKYQRVKQDYYKRYYGKSAIYDRRAWTPYEDSLVLLHSISDRELSGKIKRSMKAIQVRRSRLKKGAV